MVATTLTTAHAIAAVVALCLYALAVCLFAIADSPDFGRLQGPGLDFSLTYFVLYSVYFGLYLGLASALIRGGSTLSRTCIGVGVSLSVPPTLAFGFAFGFLLGLLLFLFPGLLLALVGAFAASILAVPITGAGLVGAFAVSILAVPITGAVMGMGFNSVLTDIAGDRESEVAALRSLRLRNVVTTAACACIAAYLAYSNGMGHVTPLGRAQMTQEIVGGLLGPVLHAGAAVMTALDQPPTTRKWRLGREATGALASIVAIMLGLLGVGIAVGNWSLGSTR